MGCSFFCVLSRGRFAGVLNMTQVKILGMVQAGELERKRGYEYMADRSAGDIFSEQVKDGVHINRFSDMCGHA